jgi:anti-sigma regulatory factor (Ser/Thr protein kinase)
VNAPASPTRVRPTGYHHEALLFRGVDDFLRPAVPFVADALAADEPVMVAVIDAHWEPLRDALGPDADRVHHVDMGELGRNPARIIPAWRDFVDRHRTSGPMRGIGEPIWAGRRHAEVAECQLHEALLNVALPPRTPMWLLCPYDVDALEPDVVEEARRSHPTVTTGVGSDESAGFGGADHAHRLWSGPLPRPRGAVQAVSFRRGDLAAVRALVRRRAASAALPTARAEDLALAVNELAANSVDHGGGGGVLRMWLEPGAFLCEIEDSGRIDDVLVGRTSPTLGQTRGRGVWMVNQLCDLVQIRSADSGTVVRVHSWL